MRWAFVVISLILTWPLQAQDLYSTGNCEQARAETILEVGNVRARVFNNGPLFWRGSPHIYEVPAGGGVNAVFSANLLLAGFVEDDVRVAGSTYGPYEFWPGPLPVDGSAPLNCARYDRIWELDFRDDLLATSSGRTPSENVLEWPTENGAPFVDVNGETGYQPLGGDHPVMYGDMQAFWIMNDRGNTHQRFDSAPLAVEVQAHAFGFDVPGDVGNTTFYRYRVENKGTHTIREMGIGFFVDVDLGDFDDDYVGTDTTNSMLYFYNADNNDFDNGYGYGPAPPAIGIAILEASHANGSLPSDTGGHPGSFATASVWNPGGGGVTGDPDNAEHIHHFMNGRWKDGTPITEGGDGWRNGSVPMPFAMPGDPVTGQYWSEVNSTLSGRPMRPSDRRGFVFFGSFDLDPGQWARFTFAYVWARGRDHLDSVVELRDAARHLHENKEALLAPRDPNLSRFIDGNPPEDSQFPFWVDEPYPNPTDDQLALRASFDKSGPLSVRVSDALGRTRISEVYTANEAGQQTITLDVSALAPGSYSVSLESRSHRQSHAFVVLR